MTRRISRRAKRQKKQRHRAKCAPPTDNQSEPRISMNSLPPELRRQIWQDTMEGQYVVVWKNKVCCHHFNELLRHYTPISLQDREGHPLPREQKCYVNFKIDTFVFPGCSLLDNAFRAMGEHSQFIQSLAFSTDMHNNIDPRNVQAIKLKLPQLKAIYIHQGISAQSYHIEIYNPCREYLVPKVFQRCGRYQRIYHWNWDSFLESLKEHVAERWGSHEVPFKGIVSCDPRRSKGVAFYIGEIRHWMKVSDIELVNVEKLAGC
jgi:hypothetical protein